MDNENIKGILDKLKSDINGKFEWEYIDGYYVEQIKPLLDYITNLQQINDNLTTSLNKKIKEGINLQQENHELKSKLECYENGAYYSSKVDELEQKNEDYKSRCEKAIEYNKEIVDNYLEEDGCEYCDGRYATAKHNLNILQNGSDSQ